MILAVDVHYKTDYAKAVSVEFEKWDAEQPHKINAITITEVKEYVPGAFFKRELPCVLEVLKCSSKEGLECIVIDGYVILNDEGKLGMGGHLFEKLEGKIPVIGVAKKSFFNNKKYVREWQRGNSKNPLFVTCLGMDVKEALSLLSYMKGEYRMPDLLRILDQQTKEP